MIRRRRRPKTASKDAPGSTTSSRRESRVGGLEDLPTPGVDRRSPQQRRQSTQPTSSLENPGRFMVLRSRADSTRVLATTTGKDGDFTFAHIPAGSYVVE